jgi:hypothetical protein
VAQDITREELKEKVDRGDDLRDPRIALSFVDAESPYPEVKSEMARIEEDANLNFINSMVKKYFGPNRYPYHRPGDERVVVVVEPRHTTQMCT